MSSAVDAAAEPSAYAPPSAREEPEGRAVATAAIACVDCGAPVERSFCAACGEARPVAGRLRMRHLVAEFVGHLTNLDFRVLRTLAALVRRPGSLTCDFIAGRRNRHTRPLALYLLVSGGFFLLSPHLPGKFYDPTNPITRNSIDSPAGRHFEWMARRRGETRVEMAARVRRSAVSTPRMTGALMAPMLASMVALLLLGRRRLLAEHVLFAIHLQTFLLMHAAVMLAAMGAAAAVGHPVFHALGARWVTPVVSTLLLAIGVVGGALLLAHVFAAHRHVYELGRVGAAWRTVVIVVALPFAIMIGRLALVYVGALAGL